MKLEPNELMGSIGISCRYIRAQINLGKFERSGSEVWEISLAGISKSACRREEKGSAYHPRGGRASPFCPSPDNVFDLRIASCLLEAAILRTALQEIYWSNLLTHSCKAAKKPE